MKMEENSERRLVVVLVVLVVLVAFWKEGFLRVFSPSKVSLIKGCYKACSFVIEALYVPFTMQS